MSLHSELSCQSSSKSVHPLRRYDVISIFKMAAAAAQFYFRFKIGWRRSFSDVSFYQQTKFRSYNSIHGWDITISAFKKTNVRHIGILLPVSISTISPQSACHSAPVCEIISKSDRLLQKNYGMWLFKMADFHHLGFWGSNYGFFKKLMYDFLQVVNRDHSSKLLSFWENCVFFAFWR